MILTEEVFEKAHYDIIVCGGGVGGCAAAIQSARDGKKVLLIEKSQKLGGLATLGLVNWFVPMCNGRGKQIIFGMCEELLRLSIKYGYGGVNEAFVNGKIPQTKLDEYSANGQLPPRYCCSFSHEIFALQLTELCVNEGVDLLFDTVVSRPVYEENNGIKRLNGVVVENKSGREYYTAAMFVDATGDSDILYRTGIQTAERGNYHSYFGRFVSLETCEQAVKNHNIQLLYRNISGGGASLYGDGHPKEIPLYYGTSSDEINRYLISNQLEMLNSIKKDDRMSRDISILPGMCNFRTTRRIVGEYTLKESDVYRHFDDSVGAINDFDRRDFLFEIPYGTLVSKQAANIITCGRTVSGDGFAWDVLRVIPPAIISGQAAGFACSQALNENKNICNINVEAIQQKLADANVTIHFDDCDVPTK